MKKLLIMLLVSIGAAAHAGEAKPAKYQAFFLASYINGTCQARQQTGTTSTSALTGKTTTSAPVAMPEDEKAMCEYVRIGLADKCFERGDCPNYDKWLKNRSQAK